MIQKQTLTLNCLFLHDTQMSYMEQEQALFRAFYPENNETTALPFNFLPAFCLAGDHSTSEKMIIQAPVVYDGWIIRPVPGIQPTASVLDTAGSEIPGFPPLPTCPGFILGYAGITAKSLLADFLKEKATGTVTAPPATSDTLTFTVGVWYTAPLSIHVEYTKGAVFSISWKRGKQKWQKVHL